MYEPKKEEITAEQRKLYDTNFYNFVIKIWQFVVMV
jgi:hypothetical protein